MNNIIRCFLLMALLVSYSDKVFSDETAKLKVFVFAGQSNMLGRRSIIDELPPHLLGRQQGNLIFSEGRWVPLEPGVYQENGLGPELSFAYDMARELGEPIGIIKHSLGGTDLAFEWAPTDPASLYAELVTLVKDAKAEMDIQILGMTWMQGESDSEDALMANSYRENLSNLVAAARRDFGGEEMFFVAGRINPPPEEKYAYADQVRSAQSNNDIERYGYVDCDDLSKLADNLHYDTLGTVMLGQLMAEKMYVALTMVNGE